ncbi:MAG: stage III sporulation protein AA [Bacillota bacterium]|nr:stage III sporulation protein AA [Bacillota bacterium]
MALAWSGRTEAGAERELLRFLPQEVRRVLEGALAHVPPPWEEIRLRAGRPLALVVRDETLFLDEAGRPAPAGRARPVGAEEVRRSLELITGHSLYAWQEELRQGFVTLPGGHRAGLAGRLDSEGGHVRTVREVSSLNLRVARERVGVARPLLPWLLERGRPLSALLLGPPGSGKTTLLRDLSRAAGDGEAAGGGGRPLRTVLVDERFEIAALAGGEPTLDVGAATDVIEGGPKAEAFAVALRALNPELLVCDELGRPEDAAALGEAARSGVAVWSSAHAASWEEARRRRLLAPLLEERFFRRVAELERRGGRFGLRAVRDGDGRPLDARWIELETGSPPERRGGPP